MRAAVEVSGPGGVRLHLVAQGQAAAAADERHGYVVVRGYEFEVFGSVFRRYPPPQNLLALTGVVAGTIDLAWDLPGPRYDLADMILRRNLGAVFPTGPTDGTSVLLPLPPPLPAAFSDTGLIPGATYSYALFAGYDEINDPPTRPADRFSPQVVGTTRTATAQV